MKRPLAARRLAVLAILYRVATAVFVAEAASAGTAPGEGPASPGLAMENRAPLAWAADEPHFLVVDRECRSATLYRHGAWVRAWHGVVFGRGDGRKLHEGDRRTPEGLYRVVAKRPHARWSRFLLLDYPNPADVAAHRRALEAGEIDADVGGAIGIHGTDAPLLNDTRVDWTLGCVSLTDRDVEELYEMVPVGTPVWIRGPGAPAMLVSGEAGP